MKTRARAPISAAAGRAIIHHPHSEKPHFLYLTSEGALYFPGDSLAPAVLLDSAPAHYLGQWFETELEGLLQGDYSYLPGIGWAYTATIYNPTNLMERLHFSPRGCTLLGEPGHVQGLRLQDVAAVLCDWFEVPAHA